MSYGRHEEVCPVAAIASCRRQGKAAPAVIASSLAVQIGFQFWVLRESASIPLCTGCAANSARGATGLATAAAVAFVERGTPVVPKCLPGAVKHTQAGVQHAPQNRNCRSGYRSFRRHDDSIFWRECWWGLESLFSARFFGASYWPARFFGANYWQRQFDTQSDPIFA